MKASCPYPANGATLRERIWAAIGHDPTSLRSGRLDQAIFRCLVMALTSLATTTSLVPQDLGKPPVESSTTADPAALIKTVAQNQKQIEETRKDYIFQRKDEERDMDSQGHVKSTEVKEYEVFFMGPWEIDRELSKNGKPLNASEQKKQDEEVSKQEKKARARLAQRDAGEEAEKNAITMAKFLAADRFYNLRLESYEGHEVYAVDFAPRPDFQPHTLVDKVLKSLGGTLWIDKQAKQGVRLEARLLEGLKMGGWMVASVQKGGKVVFEQHFVNDEVWLPSEAEIHLDARVFLLRKRVDVVSTYSDYRKFRVGSKILSPGQE